MKKAVFLLLAASFLIFSSCITTSRNHRALHIDRALKEAAQHIDSKIDPGTRIAILNITSPSSRLSTYSIDELQGAILDIGNLVLLDRHSIEQARRELNFQHSGEVSDDTMLQAGRRLGAVYVVTGFFLDITDTYRLVIRVLSVQSGTVEGQYRTDVLKDTRVRSLVEN